jgi:DNA-directed RNA polymerase alpha subunit
MSIPLDECELSTRAYNALRHEGCATLDDAARKTDAELLRIPNFGRMSLREVREYITWVKAAQAEKTRAANADVVAWAIAHPTLIRALMAREVVIVPRKGESNGVHS